MLSGTGSLDVPVSLEVAGPVTAGTLTFVSSGSVLFSNAVQGASGLVFAAGGTTGSAQLDTGANKLSLNGNITATQTTGVVRVKGAIDVGSANRLFTTSDSDAASDLVIDAVLSGSGRIQLVGPATSVIELNADNSGLTQGFRMNAADAPTVRISNANALGAGQLFWNGGTLDVAGSLTVATPISLGGPVGITGSALTLSGDVTFFTGAGSISPKVVTVSSTLTIAGKLGTSASPFSGGVGFAGSGTVLLTNAANEIGDNVTVQGATLVLRGALTGASTFVSVASGSLRGGGPAAGMVIVGDGVLGQNGDQSFDDAILSPGENAIGTLTVGSLSLLDDARLPFRLDSSGIPMVDKVISLGAVDLGAGIATLSLTDLNPTKLSIGTTLLLLDNQSASATTGFFADLAGGTPFTVGPNQFVIDYAGGDGNDVVLRAIPEPSSAWLLLGCGGALAARRRIARPDGVAEK